MGDERALTDPTDRRRVPARATPAGKPVPRFDAARHGLLARAMLIDDGAQQESAAELRRLHAQMRAELAPEASRRSCWLSTSSPATGGCAACSLRSGA